MRYLAFILTLFLPAAASAFPNSLAVQTLTSNTTSYGLALTTNYLIYSDNNSDVGIITLATGGAPQIISGLSNPLGLEVNSSGNIIYVAEYGGKEVSSWDISTFPSAQKQFVTVGNGPYGLTLSSSTLWVTNYLDNTVNAIDTSQALWVINATVDVGTNPKGIAMGNNKVYVANNGSNFATVISTSSTGNIPMNQPVDVAISGNRAYFAENNGTIKVVDLTNDTLLAGQTVTIGGSPNNITVFSSNGFDYVYVTNSPANAVTVVEYPVNPSSCPGAVTRVLLSIKEVTSPQDIVIQPGGSKAYVASAAGVKIFILEQNGPHPSPGSYTQCINTTTRTSTTIPLTTDIDGTYRVEVGGMGITGCGTYLSSGTISSGSPASITVRVTDITSSASLYAYVTDSLGRTGVAGPIGITVDTVTPGAPTGLQPSNGDGEVSLAWTAPSIGNVTGYKVYFTTGTEEPQIKDSPTTSYTVTGLVNYTLYYFTVTAYNCAGAEGPPSEPVVGYPMHVKGPAERAGEVGGCFIATEVFGPMSFEVEVLRRFRDTYLRSTIPGRWFISIYERVAPFCSVYLHTHPVLKTIVRMGLIPVAYTAWLLFGGGGGVEIHFLYFGGILLAILSWKWLKRSHSLL